MLFDIVLEQWQIAYLIVSRIPLPSWIKVSVSMSILSVDEHFTKFPDATEVVSYCLLGVKCMIFFVVVILLRCKISSHDVHGDSHRKQKSVCSLPCPLVLCSYKNIAFFCLRNLVLFLVYRGSSHRCSCPLSWISPNLLHETVFGNLQIAIGNGPLQHWLLS